MCACVRSVILRLKDRSMLEYINKALDSFFPLAIPFPTLIKSVVPFLDPNDEKNTPFMRMAIYQYLTRCVER